VASSQIAKPLTLSGRTERRAEPLEVEALFGEFNREPFSDKSREYVLSPVCGGPELGPRDLRTPGDRSRG
jgi:hypothetical protein